MKRANYTKTTLSINESYEGETIEKRIARMTENNEPITDASPQLYTERKEGVIREFDVRSDKFDNLMELTTKASKEHREKRIERQNKTNQNKDTNTDTNLKAV